ncbi:pentapeptide repeat-containing protein [Streptomyces sp. BE133]|uniref:pentapeptide repeat-containing protein n=1 Tax=Streptomyces sp. BE133 TaxID=3002523 RepID=UPI002E761094|nr:pentapeptide repeat-containing protein [Streptomyces sp. BE133]MEE1812889.1 pentapeptide repeat-containing protein [Streptomyces sp. BE133]
MTDYERAEHAARLRGLLYLACPDAPASAIESTAKAITQHSEETPSEPVPEAADLSQLQEQPSDADQLNLSCADLTGADLTDANLRRAYLIGANLTGANLTSAKLTSAKLTNAILRRADLTDAYLTGANLIGANLRDANLRGAKLIGAELIDAELIGADLTGAILASANLAGANLTEADLTDANLTDAMLTGARGMHLPARAIWNRETMWPANLASDIAEHSDEVSPGVYQVRGGGKSPVSSTVRI